MAEVREWSALEAKRWLDGPDPPRLIDCREAEEFSFCALPGAELIPLSRFGSEAVEQLTEKNQALLIYCHHGIRSRHAGDFLARLGYGNVANLCGGIDAWSLEVDPAVPRY